MPDFITTGRIKSMNQQQYTPSQTKTDRIASMLGPVNTTVTTSTGKQYTLDDKQVGWIQNRYKSKMADTYGYDDADQLAKRNGQLSAAALKTYKNTNVDRQLAELGLPSEKELGKYLEDYSRWHTGGMDQVFGQMNLPKDYWTKTKGFYQSDMQKAYENTAEDQQRKARGLMPKKWEEKYTDTEIDEQLRARGLPPLSEFGTYAERWNNYQGIENFYANVARNETNLRLAGIKDDDTVYPYNGEEYKGHDLYVNAFFDELDKVNDDGSFVYGSIRPLFKNSSSKEPTLTGDYVYDRGAAVLSENKNAVDPDDYTSYNAFSYDDYKKRYDELYQRYFANQKTQSGQLVSDALAVQAREEDEEANKAFYDVDYTDPNSFIERYKKDYPENTPGQMFDDMYANNVDIKTIWKTADTMKRQATQNYADDKVSGFYDIGRQYAEFEKRIGQSAKYGADAGSRANKAFDESDEKASNDIEKVKNLAYDYDTAYKAGDKDALYYVTQQLRAFGINNREAVDSWLEENADLYSVDNAYERAKSYMDSNGEWTVENKEAALMQLRRDGFDADTVNAVSERLQLHYGTAPKTVSDEKATLSTPYEVSSWMLDYAETHGDTQRGEWTEDKANAMFKALDDMGVSSDVVMGIIEDEASFAQLAEYADAYYNGKKLSGNVNAQVQAGIKDAEAAIDATLEMQEKDDATIDATKNAIRNPLAAIIDERDSVDVDTVLSVLDQVGKKSSTNPTAMRLALTDLGFLDDELSGWAGDITEGWSDADKRKLNYYLGGNNFTSMTAGEGGANNDWSEASSSTYSRQLKTDKFMAALDWAQQQIESGERTEWEAYQVLAAMGYQNEMQTYMPEEWHRAHYVENVLPGLWAQAEEPERLLYEEMTTEERRAADLEMWNNLSAEKKSAIYDNPHWWKFDPSVYRTFGQALEQQFQAVLPGLGAEIISTPVKVLDAIDAGISGRPEMWETTQNLMEFQQRMGQLGAVTDNVNGAQVAQTAADVVQEIGRMYYYGSIGGAIGGAFAGTSAGAAVMSGAASSSKVVRGASKMFMSMVKSSPFMVSAFANNYSEVKALGASNSEATWFGLITGLTEGILEGFEFDELWGKALGQKNFAELLTQGKHTYLERLGIIGKSWVSSAAVSGLGEFTEESIGYVLDTFLKMRHSDTWGKGTEWSTEDWLQQAMMGFITGALGGGIKAGSSWIADGVKLTNAMKNNQQLQAALPDVLASIGIAESVPDSTMATYREGGASIMSKESYDGALTALKSCTDAAQNNINEYKKVVAAEDLKLGNRLRELDGYAAKVQSIDTSTGKGAKELANLVSSKLGVKLDMSQPLAPQVKAAFKASVDSAVRAHDTAVSDIRASTETALQNSELELQGLQKKFQEHYVGLYLQNEGLLNSLSEDMLTNLAQAYQNGAKYEPGQAAEQQAAKQSKLAEAEANETIEETKETAEAQKKAEAEQPTTIRRLTDDEVAKVQQAAKDLKYKGDVVFIDDPNAEDAWIDDNGTITINRANISEAEAKELADNPGWWLLKHEFTHFTEGTAEYEAYSNAVQDILRRRFGDNYGRVLEAIKQDYAQHGRTLDDTGAVRELVAKFSQSGDILNNAETINAFVREQGTVADRIYNWIRYKINDLKLRRKPNSALARELLNAERLYAQAYRAANRKAPKYGSSTSAQFATGRSLQSLTDEYAGAANPRTGVTAEEDAAYMRAALAGDTETAGRMVRDMYERNGLMHVYRGEPKATGSWTQVNMDNFKGPSSGMFAATDIDTARASEYTHSYAREDLKTKPLSYGDEMPVLQQFADGVAQRIGRGMNLIAESYYMDDEGNTYAEDGKGREHHWALRDADTGDIFADSTELTTLADAAKRKAARLIGGNPQNIYNSIDDPFAGRILDLFVKFDNANEHNARGDEWDKIQLGSPKGVTLYRIEVAYDPENENLTTVTAYPIDESFDAESSSASEREAKSITFESEDDMDYMYKLEKAFKDMFGPKSDVAEFFMDYADWNEDGATLDKVGVRDKNGRYVSPELFPDAETTSTDELALRDKAAGYDRSIIRNVRDGGSMATTDTVSFNPNYIKSADAITYDDEGNIIPLSQRGDFSRNELRYSTGRSLNDLLNEYGSIDQGRNPRARDVQVPRQTNDMNRVSQWIRSLIESGKLTDDQAQNVLQMVVEQDYGTYVPTSQAERMEEARAYIAERQPLQAQQEFHDMVMQGKFGVKTNALGIQLLSDASARGDIASVLDIAADLQLAATEAGQSAQIFNVLKELKGVGSAWYMQKVIDRMNAKYADRIAAGKMSRISVDPALMAELAKATTVDQMAAAEEAVAKDIARQLPLTWDDRLSSWRYFSMLANPTTHIRNIVGNLLMKGLNTAKDAVATGLENILGVDQSDRAHAILSQADKNTWGNWVQQSYEEQARNLSGGSKLGFESFVKQNMRSFDNKFVNALAQFNFKALENEDIAFIKPAYKNALMQYMVAQGYTLNEKGVAGKTNAKGEFVEMTKAQQNAAIDWASQQAWKQTFRDASSLATMLNKLSKENAVSRLLVEGVMPFKKTPINIARRGVDYSPAGIIKGIAQLTNGVKKGKVTTAQAIDTLSSGITGSALMALGVMLAKLGVIRAGGDKDKKLETFLEDTGDQTYAVKFGDKSINMSSIAPATIPLFMGVALNEMIEQGGDSLDLSTITDTIAGTLNPFMEMSFMSSLNSALKNYNANGIGGALGSTLMTAAQNYGSQYLPTLGGKIAQFLDPTRRTTKSDITSPVGSNMDYYARSLAKKVPGLESTLQPDVDIWGRTDTKDSFGDWALDFANKFILPTNIKVTNRDAVDNELIRVVESTGVTDFLPSDGNKYFTVNKQKYQMNARQYTQYSQERGQAAYAALKDTMASASYKMASDEQKASMLKKALDAAYKQVSNQWKEKLGAYNN